MTASVDATPTAEIIGVRGGYVRIACPHCNSQHAHPQANIGSAEVLAPCHRNHAKLRTYSIRPKRKTVQ